MLEKFAKMSVQQAMVTIAGSRPGYGEQPRWFEAIAKATGITERMARSLWRGEITKPDHWAAEKVRREAEILEAKREAAKLASQFTAIAGGLRATDENFFGPEIDRLERLVRIIGGLDRP